MQPWMVHLPVLLKEDVWCFLLSCCTPSLELSSSQTTSCYFATPVLVELHQLTRRACHIFSQIVSGLGLLFHLIMSRNWVGMYPHSLLTHKMGQGCRYQIPITVHPWQMVLGVDLSIMLTWSIFHVEAHDWYRIWCSFPPPLYFRDIVALAKQLWLWDRGVGKWDHMPKFPLHISESSHSEV